MTKVVNTGMLIPKLQYYLQLVSPHNLRGVSFANTLTTDTDIVAHVPRFWGSCKTIRGGKYLSSQQISEEQATALFPSRRHKAIQPAQSDQLRRVVSLSAEALAL